MDRSKTCGEVAAMRQAAGILLILAAATFGFGGDFSGQPVFAQSAEQCRYGNDVTELFEGDTFIGYRVVNRQNAGFKAADPRMTEVAAYLDHLRLPPLITSAVVVLRKSLVLYEPGHLDHTGKPWYDHVGNVVEPQGDGGVFKDLKKWDAQIFRKVRLAMLDFQEKHFWGPFVLYENEDEGKGVVDLEVVLLDRQGCWIDMLHASFYQLPQKGAVVNIDNVDGGNENGRVVLFPCGTPDYIRLTGGTAGLYPERAKELRHEWNAVLHEQAVYGMSSNTSLHAGLTLGGKKIVYETIAVYPHLASPAIAVVYSKEYGGYHLVAKLPKYFSGKLIPTFVALQCADEKTIKVRMLRGSQEKVFTVTISTDPKDAVVEWSN